ncbi:hypothetical protein STEG23_036651, partial [Scotinomys teguina]
FPELLGSRVFVDIFKSVRVPLYSVAAFAVRDPFEAKEHRSPFLTLNTLLGNYTAMSAFIRPDHI